MIHYYWILGMAGSGKTYHTEIFKGMGFKPYSDADYLQYELAKDIEFKYHKLLDDGFMITGDKPYYDAYKKMFSDLSKCKGNAVIEFVTQLDKEGVYDFSFSEIIPLIPREVLNDSIFIYLQSPFETRVERKKGIVPKEAMERFFKEDDALYWLSEFDFNYTVINNL